METIREYVPAAPLAAVLTTPRGTRNLPHPEELCQQLLSRHALLGILGGVVSFTSAEVMSAAKASGAQIMMFGS